MKEKTNGERLYELVLQVKDLDLTPEEKSGNAVMFLTCINNHLTTKIDGSSDKLANMLYDMAVNYPVFGEILKRVVAEL